MKHRLNRQLYCGIVLLISCLLSACSSPEAASNFFKLTENVIKTEQVQKIDWKVERTLGGYQFVARIELKNDISLMDIFSRTTEVSVTRQSDQDTLKLESRGRSDTICLTEIPGAFSKLLEKAPWWDLKFDVSFQGRLQRGRNRWTHDGVHWWLLPVKPTATNVIYVVGSGA
jgi:hypothetical protein